jgi:hypothetical protein
MTQQMFISNLIAFLMGLCFGAAFIIAFLVIGSLIGWFSDTPHRKSGVTYEDRPWLKDHTPEYRPRYHPLGCSCLNDKPKKGCL